MKMSVWSLACRQSIFYRYHSEKHLREFYPQDGGESQLEAKLRQYMHMYVGLYVYAFRWLGSRVVSVLDSGAEGPGLKLQPRRSLRQTVHTHRASVHQVANLVAALLSNGSLLPGLWLTPSAGWLPRTGISSGTLRSVIDYALPLPLPFTSPLRLPFASLHPRHNETPQERVNPAYRTCASRYDNVLHSAHTERERLINYWSPCVRWQIHSVAELACSRYASRADQRTRDLVA